MYDTTSEAAIHVRDAILRAAEHIGHTLQQLTEVIEALRWNLLYAMPLRQEGREE